MQRYLFYWFDEKMKAKTMRFFVFFSSKDEKNTFLKKKVIEKFGV